MNVLGVLLPNVQFGWYISGVVNCAAAHVCEHSCTHGHALPHAYTHSGSHSAVRQTRTVVSFNRTSSYPFYSFSPIETIQWQ